MTEQEKQYRRRTMIADEMRHGEESLWLVSQAVAGIPEATRAIYVWARGLMLAHQLALLIGGHITDSEAMINQEGSPVPSQYIGIMLTREQHAAIFRKQRADTIQRDFERFTKAQQKVAAMSEEERQKLKMDPFPADMFVPKPMSSMPGEVYEAALRLHDWRCKIEDCIKWKNPGYCHPYHDDEYGNINDLLLISKFTIQAYQEDKSDVQANNSGLPQHDGPQDRVQLD